MAIYNGGLSIKNVSIGTATGSGNAITSLSADGNVITPDKGSTFLKAQGRTRRNITSDLANLTTAIAEQNLEKYGYKIGDYFMGPSGYQYNLADMDSYYGGYVRYSVIDTHHCAIVVDAKSTCQWIGGTSTGYSNSDLHAFLKGTVLNNIKNDMKTLLGGTTGLEHLLSHTPIDNGVGEWNTAWEGLKDTYICALSEVQVYGANVFSCDAYQTGTSCKQLELFSKYKFNEIIGYNDMWLRSLSSPTHACIALGAGNAAAWSLNEPMGVYGLILFR